MKYSIFLLVGSFLITIAIEGVRSCAVLTQKQCQPCEGGVSPYSEQDALAQLSLLEGWKLTAANGCFRISRSWRAKNFLTALNFLREVGTLAESEGHHPDLHLVSYRNVTIDVSTHAICGLSENDFILAAKINEIPIELKLEAQITPPSVPAVPLLSGEGRKVGKVHMLCGMISSGKSTYAKQLHDSIKAVVFSPDDWMLSLYGADFPVERFQEHGDTIKAHIWELAQKFLALGVDVVLDFSFWSKSERQVWRERAESAGAEVQLYYVQCPTSVLRERLKKRNERVLLGLERHFLVPEVTFEGWVGLLEVPQAEEHPIIVNSCSAKVL